MLDLLHMAAIASTAVGCCAAVVQPGAPATRARDLSMAALMLAAMVGAVTTGPGLALVWAAGAVAIGLIALPLAARTSSAERAMVALDAFGAVVMGALILVMGVGIGSGAGHHGPAPATLAVALGAAALGCGIAAAHRARRTPGWAARLRPATTGASVLLMAAAAIGAAAI
jgi:hypothetical protein